MIPDPCHIFAFAAIALAPLKGQPATVQAYALPGDRGTRRWVADTVVTLGAPNGRCIGWVDVECPPIYHTIAPATPKRSRWFAWRPDTWGLYTEVPVSGVACKGSASAAAALVVLFRTAKQPVPVHPREVSGG